MILGDEIRLTLGDENQFSSPKKKKKKKGELNFLAPYSLYSLYWVTKIKFRRPIVNTNDIGRQNLIFVA